MTYTLFFYFCFVKYILKKKYVGKKNFNNALWICVPNTNNLSFWFTRFLSVSLITVVINNTSLPLSYASMQQLVEHLTNSNIYFKQDLFPQIKVFDSTQRLTFFFFFLKFCKLIFLLTYKEKRSNEELPKQAC